MATATKERARAGGRAVKESASKLTTQLRKKPQPLFIGGKWLDSVSGKTFPTINPATGETICRR